MEKTRLDVGLLIVSTVKLEYFTAKKIAVRSITNLTVELGIIWRQNNMMGKLLLACLHLLIYSQSGVTYI